MYDYDGHGNIDTKTEYAFTLGDLGEATDTVNYIYDTDWKDKLVSYNNQSITYDAIGNPTNYMGADMSWFARQMQSYSKNGTNITYTYDADGLRTAKTVNNIKHEYYYVDGQLRYERNGDSYEMYYNYDIDGRPVRAYKKDLVTGTNYSYYLITNTRGDVVETRDGNGNVNAKYTYDSWGKLISVTDASGNALPETSFAHQISLRYRGYVYDNETGLYYLQSRYYDPETGRFLNADDVGYIGYSGEALSYNMFAYCENEPVGYLNVSCFASVNDIFRNQTNYSINKAPIVFSAINKYDIHMYIDGKGQKKDGKINVCFYPNGTLKNGIYDGNPNIRIWNSYMITDEDQMFFVLDVIMSSRYFDESIYTRSRMSYYVEWFGHNIAYLITWIFGMVGEGSLNESAMHVDLNNNEKYMAIWILLYAAYLEGQK